MEPPFGSRARNGLWTGQDDRGPHLDGPGNGTELKLFVVAVGHGLHCGGSSGGPWNDEDWEGPKPLYTPTMPPLPLPIIIACGGGGGGYDAPPNVE